MAAISEKLRIAVKLSDSRSYKIAHRAGLHPSTLSRIICRIENVKQDDPRVIAVGAVLGLPPSDCFQGDEK